LFIDTIVAFIGKGGFGEVFAVTNPRFPKRMAMKVIKMDNLCTSKDEYLKSEWGVGVTLGRKSRFLIEIVEYFTESGNAIMIMEYCGSGDLQNVIDIMKERNIRISKEV
jgi:serine/threonine protein kinase